MKTTLSVLLESKVCVVADGAMGTNLFAIGLETGNSPELWNVEQPDRVASVHQGFIDAGADIVLSNSFGGTRYRLKLHNLQDRAAELNRAAVAVARGVADAADRHIVVAGDMGPLGELFEPLGSLTMEQGVDAFTEQAQALAEAGADVLWIETLSSREEVTAAAAGVATTGLPMVCTLTFDTAGRTMMGMSPEDAATICQTLVLSPVAFGANCGNGPAELVHAMVGLTRVVGPEAVLVAKGNCGIPEFLDGRIHYNGTPEVMADYARMACDAGARIIGACCGSTPVHLKAMVDALDGYAPKGVPSIDDIESVLGPLTAAAKTAGADRRQSRQQRRRGG